MSLALFLISFTQLLGFVYLCVGRSVAVKRWLLPSWTASVAALMGLMLARAGGGGFENYAVTVPLGLSCGLVLQHLMAYCRRCGASLRLQPRARVASEATAVGQSTPCSCGARHSH